MCKYKTFGFTGLFSLHIERLSYHAQATFEKSNLLGFRRQWAAQAFLQADRVCNTLVLFVTFRVQSLGTM